jgi:hypothetical protein
VSGASTASSSWPTAASISARQAAKSPWPVRPANVGLGKAGTWTSVSGT